MYRKPVSQEQILLAKLETKNGKEAAAALAISPTTFWRRSRTPEFLQKYLAARAEANAESMECLARAAPLALLTLMSRMGDQAAGASSRVKASLCALKHADTFALENVLIRCK